MELANLQFSQEKPVPQDLILETKNSRVTADRSVQGSNFPNGPITFKINNGTEAVDLSKTKLRMRMSLSKSNGNPLKVADGIAWANNPVSCLWQRAELLCNDQVIDETSNFVSQVDTIALREGRSDAWLNSVGKTLFMEPSLDDRIQRVSADGVENAKRAKNLIDLGYDAADTLAYTSATGVVVLSAGNIQPYLRAGDLVSIDNTGRRTGTVVSVDSTTQFTVESGSLGADLGATVLSTVNAAITGIKDAARVRDYEFLAHIPLQSAHTGAMLPPGNYELRLYPRAPSEWKYFPVESYVQKTPGTDYEITVNEFYLQAETIVLSQKVPDGTYHILRENINARPNAIVSNTGLGNYNYDVEPNTHAISVAFQSNLSTTADTRYPVSKFTFGSDKAELGLNRLYIQYSHFNVPSYQAMPDFDTNVDHTTQMWTDTFANAGLIESVGGCESQRDWQERGAIYRYNFYKSPKDLSRRAAVYAQFDASASAQDNNIFVFDHSLVDTAFKVQGGVVVDCMVSQV